MPKKRPESSPAYLRILAYINSTPRLQSLLYDLNLLPEQVWNSADNKRAMIACYMGYRVGKDADLAEAEAPPARGRGGEAQ